MQPLLPVLALIASIVLVLAPTAQSARPEMNGPLDPEAALGSIRVLPGFDVDVFACEPQVADPVAFAFDKDGRVYVAEMRGYSERNAEFLGRIRLLEDSDDDGAADRSVIYADGLVWPTGVLPYDGGLFVADAPYLLYLKDTDGDDHADERLIVYTGFGTRNVQGLFNSLRWGLDNRIHFSGSHNGGEVRRHDRPPSESISLQRSDAAFDPATLQIEPTSGGVQHGMTFDNWGRKFLTSNQDHLQMAVFERRYLSRNQRLLAPEAVQTIADDGPQGDIYPISPLEEWRVTRARMRAEGTASGLLEGQGRARAVFSAGTGIVAYRGDAWPEEFRQQLFLGDVSGNLISRKRLEREGTQFTAHRLDEGFEFLASEDLWFRPVMLRNGPDGNLWFADMYRKRTEHPWSIPESLKTGMDLNLGNELGRIYIVRTKGSIARPTPKLSDATVEDLVALLEHPNGWHRTTASRLLFERQPPQAAFLIEDLLSRTTNPLGRMHCLYALEGQGALENAALRDALADLHPRVREHAVRLAEDRIDGDPGLFEAVVALADDSDPLVRQQVAFSLGQSQESQRLPTLAKLLQRDGGDEAIRVAVYSSVADQAGALLDMLLPLESFLKRDEALPIVEELTRQSALVDLPDLVARAIRIMNRLENERPLVVVAALRGLGPGLPLGQTVAGALNDLGSEQAAGTFSQLMAKAGRRARDATQPLEDRAQALQTLTLASFDSVKDLLAELLSANQPALLRAEAIAVLNQFPDPSVADTLMAHWPSLGPDLRRKAMDTFLARPERVETLLDAIENGSFALNHLAPQDVERLNFYPVGKTRKRARRALLLEKVAPRFEVVQRYQEQIASNEGDPREGRRIFEQSCLACHRLEGRGNAIGPDISGFARRGKDALLANILDPNREINPLYENYLLRTLDGRTLSGVILSETENAVVLQGPDGTKASVPRPEIESLSSTGRSLMPEGLEASIDPKQMADLLAFLGSAN